MIKNMQGLKDYLVKESQRYGKGCEKVFVAVSGGVDSSLVVAILCEAFPPENVFGMYRDIRSNPNHYEDVQILQRKFGFNLIAIDGNPAYDNLISQFEDQFKKLGLDWAEEGSTEADENGLAAAYDSLKSRLSTPMAGFIAKAIDRGGGRIFGTGNGEEDGLLRYFDKFGDGAVDNNVLAGLTKAEVRQLAHYMGVPKKIIRKVPSADLRANGDFHNDENQLTQWAKNMGFDIQISYGSADGSNEGNIAWAWKEDIKTGVITGVNNNLSAHRLWQYGYIEEEVGLIMFLREMEKSTRHKELGVPGVKRSNLLAFGFVD